MKWIYRSVVKCIYRSMVKWTGKCTCNPARSMNPPPPNCVQCISRTVICRSFPCLTHRIQCISCIMSHSFPCLIHRVQCTSCTMISRSFPCLTRRVQCIVQRCGSHLQQFCGRQTPGSAVSSSSFRTKQQAKKNLGTLLMGRRWGVPMSIGFPSV